MTQSDGRPRPARTSYIVRAVRFGTVYWVVVPATVAELGRRKNGDVLHRIVYCAAAPVPVALIVSGMLVRVGVPAVTARADGTGGVGVATEVVTGTDGTPFASRAHRRHHSRPHRAA